MATHLKARLPEVRLRMKQLRGMFISYKDPKQTMLDVRHLLSLQLTDELVGMKNGSVLGAGGILHVNNGPLLPYDAKGLFVIAIGENYAKYNRYLCHLSSIYNITVQLGTATETHTTSGRVIEQKPYDHVRADELSERLVGRVGPVEMAYSPHFYQHKNSLLSSVDPSEWTLKVPSTVKQSRLISARLTDFRPPLFDIELVAEGPFNPCGFVDNLCRELKSFGHVHRIRRDGLGPFRVSDALPSYRWTSNHIVEQIERHRETFYDIIGQFRSRFPELIYLRRLPRESDSEQCD